VNGGFGGFQEFKILEALGPYGPLTSNPCGGLVYLGAL